MFTRLVVLFIATSLHKTAGLEGITQFSFAEQPPKVEVTPKVEESNSLSSPEVLPRNSGVVEPSSQEVLPQRLETPGENGAGTPKVANEEVKPIVPPVAEKDEEIRGLKNPFTSNPQLTDADQRLQDFSKQLKEASTQMSGLYDTLVAQMDLYKHVLGTMVHNSRTLMSNMKVMLHEEGTALEMKNQARMKPVLGLDALIKEHHEILEVAGVGEEEGPKVEVKPKVHEESTVEVQPTAHEESPKATVEVQPKETNEEPPKTVEVQPQANGFFKGEVQPTVHEESPKATVEVKPNA